MGQKVHFTTAIENQGTGPAEDARLVWRPSSSAPFLLEADGLSFAAGESKTIEFDYTYAEEGTYVTTAMVSLSGSTSSVASSDGNSKSLEVIVGSPEPTPTPTEGPTPTPTSTPTPSSGNPDPVITGLSADDTNPAIGQSVHFAVVLRNEGDGLAEGLRLVWHPSAGSPFLLVADNLNLDASEQKIIQFAYTYTEEGTFETLAVLYFDSMALSAGGDSNAKLLTITVGPETSVTVSAAVGAEEPTATQPVSTEEPAATEPAATEEPTMTEEPAAAETPLAEEPTETGPVLTEESPVTAAIPTEEMTGTGSVPIETVVVPSEPSDELEQIVVPLNGVVEVSTPIEISDQ